MKIPVFDLTGTKKKDVVWDEALTVEVVNKELIAQAVRVYLANQRQASAVAKTRGAVRLSGKKIFRQKGTGNARHGSRRAPIFVGGGKAHGPKLVQHYHLELPKKMRRVALLHALYQQISQEKVVAVEGLATLKKPSTKQLAGLLQEIGSKAKTIGLVLHHDMESAVQSSRNLERVTNLSVDSLTTYTVLKPSLLVFSTEALESIKQRLGKD